MLVGFQVSKGAIKKIPRGAVWRGAKRRGAQGCTVLVRRANHPSGASYMELAPPPLRARPGSNVKYFWKILRKCWKILSNFQCKSNPKLKTIPPRGCLARREAPRRAGVYRSGKAQGDVMWGCLETLRSPRERLYIFY